MTVSWPSDGAVIDAADKLTAKFGDLMMALDVMCPPEDVAAWLGRNGYRLRLNAEHFTSLDPAALLAHFDHLRMATLEIGIATSDAGRQEHDNAKEHLSDWSGDAADAFRNRLSHIETFSNTHAQFTLSLFGCAAGLVKIAISARENYLRFAESTIANIDKMMSDNMTKQVEWAFKSLANVGKAAIGMLSDPRQALTITAQSLLDGATETASYLLNAPQFGEVVKSFSAEEQRLRDGYDNELAALTEVLRTSADAIRNKHFFLEDPLPTTVDVHGPDFRYDSFYSRSLPPDTGIDARVDEERRRMAEDGTGKRTPIRARLDGE